MCLKYSKVVVHSKLLLSVYINWGKWDGHVLQSYLYRKRKWLVSFADNHIKQNHLKHYDLRWFFPVLNQTTQSVLYQWNEYRFRGSLTVGTQYKQITTLHISCLNTRVVDQNGSTKGIGACCFFVQQFTNLGFCNNFYL